MKTPTLICLILAITFVAMKVAGVLAWTWWAVLSPLIVLGGLFIVFFAIVLFSVFVATIVVEWAKTQRKSYR